MPLNTANVSAWSALPLARRNARCVFTCGLVVATACSQVTDVVFRETLEGTDAATGVHFVTQEFRVRESARSVTLVIELSDPVRERTSVAYAFHEAQAQSSCPLPDYTQNAGEVAIEPGQTQFAVQLQLADDDYAELDEALDLELRAGPVRETFSVVIEDDERTAIIDAADHGVVPASSGDQSAALQAAFDAAAESGRGVVTLGPGEYVIRSVDVPPGTSLVVPGVVLRSPANLADGTPLLDVHFGGETDALPTLIEAVTLDGNRRQQGPYQNKEKEQSHLIAVTGDSTLPGRVVLGVERVTLRDGTADGVGIAENADVTACSVTATDLWREAVGILGGNSRLWLRGLRASATAGTAGVWFSGWPAGYDGITAQTIVLEDVELGSGDFEAELEPGSSLEVQRLHMAAPPFRLQARDANVYIDDSVLVVGPASERHNTFSELGDVTISNSQLILSELEDELGTATEADRTMALVTVTWPEPDAESGVVSSGKLTLDQCQFDLADNVEAADTVYAVSSTGNGGIVEVVGSVLGAGVSTWFGPDCEGCRLE